MSLIELMNERNKMMDIWDIALIKWCVFCFALAIAKVWEPVLSMNISFYLVLGLIFVIRPMYHFYFKKV